METIRDVLTRASHALADKEHISHAGAADLLKDMTWEQVMRIAGPRPAEPAERRLVDEAPSEVL